MNQNRSAMEADPELNPDALKSRFGRDIARDGIPHSTFGVGPHLCIDSNLARIELQTTLEEWLKRIPNFAVKPGASPKYVTGFLRSMRELQLVWPT